MKVVLSTLNAKFIHSSLALKYLEVSCRAICSEIIIKEYTINNELLNILSDLYQEQPAVVGLACYIWNIDMTLKLAGLLKKVLPETVIVLGGPEVTYDAAAMMEQHSCIDYIVQGEGEEILKQLLVALQSAAPVGEIQGLAWRNKQHVVVGKPQIVANLNEISFPYCAADIDKLKDKIIYYESARGCPFSCSYCLSSATQGVRFFSVERVYRDLEFFIKHNVRQVKFVDRTFNARKEHYLPILRFLASRECRTNFHFEIAADVLDEEVLEFLKTVPVGRFQFEIGVQSTYELTLKKISRHNNWPKIMEYVTTIVSYQNIHVHLDLIVGLPNESYAQFGKSFNDVYQLQPHMLQIGFLKLLKGAGIRKAAAADHYVALDYAPYEVLANQWLSYGEIRKLKIIEEIFNQIYNSGRFKYTLQYLILLHGGDAFAFYHDLATYWEERELHIVAHSSKSLYQYILDFCQSDHSEEVTVVQEFLKFDALLSERGAVRSECLNWNKETWNKAKGTFWSNQQQVQKYLPEYTFTTWRDLNKRYQIEVFAIDIPAYLQSGDVIHKQTPILFCYAETTSWQTLSGDEFMQGGGQDDSTL